MWCAMTDYSSCGVHTQHSKSTQSAATTPSDLFSSREKGKASITISQNVRRCLHVALMDWHHKTWILFIFIQENPQVLDVLTSKCLKCFELTDQFGLNRFHSSCVTFHVARISRKCVFSFKVIIKSFEKLSLIKCLTVNWSTSNWIRTNQLNFYKQIREWLKALASVCAQLSILIDVLEICSVLLMH